MQKSNGNYADSHLVTSSFLESSTELTCMAGLLTYPRSEQPSHPSRIVAKVMSKRCIGLTVAGLLRTYT